MEPKDEWLKKLEGVDPHMANMQAGLMLLDSGWRPMVAAEVCRDSEFSMYLHPNGDLTLRMVKTK